MWVLFVFGAAALAGLVIALAAREEARKRQTRESHWEEVDLRSLKDDPERRKEILKRRKMQD